MKKFISILITIISFFSLSSCSIKEKAVSNTQRHEVENGTEENLSRIKQLKDEASQKDKEIATLNSKLTTILNDQKQLEEIIYSLKNEMDKDNTTSVKHLINVLKDKIDKRNITFDDQKQVEQLIKDYFTCLERKDYSLAWKLVSSEMKSVGSKDDFIKNHYGVESIKLISMKGYIPPKRIGTGESANWEPMTDASPDIPTVCFTVDLDIEPSSNTAWNRGVNTCFVDVVKESDGNWRINGLPTGP